MARGGLRSLTKHSAIQIRVAWFSSASMTEEAMTWLLIKIGLFLCLWYEVSVELGLSQGTAFALTLMICGAGLMVLRLPGQLLAMLGPQAIAWVGPGVIWFGMAWWLMPNAVGSYPGLTLVSGTLLALAGAGLHYTVSRYPAWFARRNHMLRGSIVPVICVLLGLFQAFATSFLTFPVIALLMGMPLRFGWRFIGPAAPHKFDARMGDYETFRRDGFSRDS